MFGALLGGYTVVNVNPLYTARELAHQLNDSGARVLVVIENFAHVVEEAKPQLKIERVVVATAGDLMGFKGHIVNFVARRIKKVVKPFDLPGFVPLATVLAGSDAMAPVTVTPDDIAFLQYAYISFFCLLAGLATLHLVYIILTNKCARECPELFA